jgi:retron-type reverse transcriptase
MQNFDSFFTRDKIIKYLCKQRAKLAKNRSKEHILSRISLDTKYNYHKRVKRQNQNDQLCLIMPPRRLWINLPPKKRYDVDGKINSIDKNEYAIYSTIKKHMRGNEKYDYIERLNQFIDDILKDINSKSFRFSKPKIRPELKEKKDGKNIYRPISSFSLRDNLINCLTNKYLTRYFNELFYENSFAFRSACMINNQYKIPSHHDAFKKIVDYLKENSNKGIFVAECDMKKFYDSVSHKIALQQFNRLCVEKNNSSTNYKMFLRQFRKFHIKKYDSSVNHKILLRQLKRSLIRKHSGRCDKRAKRIFTSYLNSYNFFSCVHNLNGNEKYFKEMRRPVGEFEWVEKEIRQIYSDKHITDIGIPQGGALSGLISNIVLDYADRKILELNDRKLLYVRYCDDMIIMHTDKEKCGIALNKYMKALKKLGLFPHEIKNVPYSKDFWSSKSKGPYEWSEKNVPWVGFVGYEINKNGEIRVRKKSLKKEKDKQKKLINNVISAISSGNLRTSKNTVIESTVNRLIGMAVGRVELWNYKNCKNDMCWAKGFNLLNNNRYSRVQVKALDRSRNRNLIRLYDVLNKIDDSNVKERNKESNRQIIFYGKPFSYFYQVIEKNARTRSL